MTEKKTIEFSAKAVGIEMRLLPGFKLGVEFKNYTGTKEQFNLLKSDPYVQVAPPIIKDKKENKKPKEFKKEIKKK